MSEQPGNTNWRPPQPHPILQRFKERCLAEKKQPFLDEQPLVGVPRCSWANFRQPLLRACPLTQEIDWKETLGHGIDGMVWKVEIGGHNYALKVFWDEIAPDGTTYWAVQRECQSAALLQMIRASVEASSTPIRLNAEPQTHDDALRNLHAFSDEGKSKSLVRETTNSVLYSSFPRFRECFGWMTIPGKALWGLNRAIRPHEVRVGRVKRTLRLHAEYHAILYEFIPRNDCDPDIDVMQAQLDLLWRVGFCVTPILDSGNWEDGILLDMSDLICPWHVGWAKSRYMRVTAKDTPVA